MIQTIEIKRLGLMGQGVGYDNSGNIFFVKGALPGDEVEISFTESKRYRDANLIKILKPSPDRISSPCSHFETCGGCDLLNLEYTAQVKAKVESLKHVLERSQYVPEKYLEPRPSEKVYGYRNRIQLKKKGESVGFFKKKTHDMVPINSCLIAHESINHAIRELPLSLNFKDVEIIHREGEVSTFFDKAINQSVFEQVNPEQNEILKLCVRNRMVQMGAKNVLELFCGYGNLTFGYSMGIQSLVAVDSNKRAIDLALKKSTEKIIFLNERVDESLTQKISREYLSIYDTLLLDPPRKGVGSCLRNFLKPNLKNIIYVSCNPITFSSDVQILKQMGFLFREVELIDMFPHTRHIEFIATFTF